MSDARIPDDDGIQVDDIRAIRGEGRGELRALMRSQIAIGRSRREPPPKPVPSSPPGHRPGAWPTGASPPGPPPDWQIPTPVWRAAARHCSNQTHRPDEPCDCGNCPEENR
ncbi:hypothetical protein C9F11_38030 [Streptomyces sp. YIM 121038]|uniref:hypothetical protein n=1 Tax=Streptomyces sp. YIM 121038 TaxID=2136401 RepID=UPI00111055D0|nr:hypothetical protein [Streptomyces sp. YIM 121038]QCX81189.1 hypothetical protein C9F11_38030 [Streptomyces sp. YIM 121038]